MSAADIESMVWAARDLGRALTVMASRLGGEIRSETVSPPEDVIAASEDALGAWIEATATWLSFEAEPYAATYGSLEGDFETLGPTLVRVSAGDNPGFLLILRVRAGICTAMTPKLEERRISIETLVSTIASSLRGHVATHVDGLLASARISEKRHGKVRQALLRERIGTVLFTGIWVLRPAVHSTFFSRARELGLIRSLGGLISIHAAYYVLWVVSWWMIGAAALEGSLDFGWFWGWVLLLLTLIPLRLLVTWTQNRLAIGLGGLLKQRLLHGALRQDPADIRKEGVGHLLGRVLESEAIEATAIGGGIAGLLALIELVMAGGILGLVSWWCAGLLGGWSLLTLVVGYRYFRWVEKWSASRLALTHDLVERMVGQRTRLAQQAPSQWHEGEDQSLDGYLEDSVKMDRTMPWLVAGVPRGWMLLGILGISPLIVTEPDEVGLLPVAIGGGAGGSVGLRTVGCQLGFPRSRRHCLGASQASFLCRVPNRTCRHSGGECAFAQVIGQ